MRPSPEVDAIRRTRCGGFFGGDLDDRGSVLPDGSARMACGIRWDCVFRRRTARAFCDAGMGPVDGICTGDTGLFIAVLPSCSIRCRYGAYVFFSESSNLPVHGQSVWLVGGNAFGLRRSDQRAFVSISSGPTDEHLSTENDAWVGRRSTDLRLSSVSSVLLCIGAASVVDAVD